MDKIKYVLVIEDYGGDVKTEMYDKMISANNEAEIQWNLLSNSAKKRTRIYVCPVEMVDGEWEELNADSDFNRQQILDCFDSDHPEVEFEDLADEIRVKVRERCNVDIDKNWIRWEKEENESDDIDIVNEIIDDIDDELYGMGLHLFKPEKEAIDEYLTTVVNYL